MSVKIGLVAVAIEQRAKRVDVVGRGGDIRAHVAAVTLVHLSVVIARAAGMYLHDQPVFDAHAAPFQ